MSKLISRTGRVQSWLDNPESRLPVSCTVFVVEDSMEGENGIEASWRYVSHGLRFGAGVAVHLSKLRPKGAENGRGLTASGPVSFGKIYSTLNENSEEAGSTKMVLLYCILILTMPISLILLMLQEKNSPGSRGASILIRENGTTHLIK